MSGNRVEERVTLHDGSAVTVRDLVPADGAALHEFYRGLPEEDRLFLKEDVTQPVFMERFLAKLNDVLIFSPLALQAGRIVGHGALYRNSHGWTVHVGEIRVVVAREYQRRGLGSILAKLLVKRAINLGLDKMVAKVVDNQVAAKRAFEKLGFHAEAVLKGHVRDIHGKRRDLVIMSDDVTHLWHTMEELVADYHPSLE